MDGVDWRPGYNITIRCLDSDWTFGGPANVLFPVDSGVPFSTNCELNKIPWVEPLIDTNVFVAWQGIPNRMGQ